MHATIEQVADDDPIIYSFTGECECGSRFTAHQRRSRSMPGPVETVNDQRDRCRSSAPERHAYARQRMAAR